MNRSYRGACERLVDRITQKLLAAGYRPDGSCCVEKHRSAYMKGERWNGSYIRFPRETWIKKETPAAGTARESK